MTDWLGVSPHSLGKESVDGRTEGLVSEDAFQAIFLILARKARSVEVDDSLGRWLRGVARRVAARTRVRATREIPARPAANEQRDDPAVEGEALHPPPHRH